MSSQWLFPLVRRLRSSCKTSCVKNRGLRGTLPSHREAAVQNFTTNNFDAVLPFH